VGDPWSIYNLLSGGIPADLAVNSCLVGQNWIVVDSTGTGLAMNCRGGTGVRSLKPPHAGRSVRVMAEYLKSWNLGEASLGMAAVNSFYNTPERLTDWLSRPLESLHGKGALVDMLDRIAGKKVAVVGHFPDMDEAAENCDLVVLERQPQDGDLPDFAAEYVLPQQDYVFITGTTITNKTLPRLLQLAKNAVTVLLGPSIPLVPWWFDHGVDVLAGTVVVDRESVWRHCQEGGLKAPFDNGAWMVQMTRDDLVPGPTSTGDHGDEGAGL